MTYETHKICPFLSLFDFISYHAPCLGYSMLATWVSQLFLKQHSLPRGLCTYCSLSLFLDTCLVCPLTCMILRHSHFLNETSLSTVYKISVLHIGTLYPSLSFIFFCVALNVIQHTFRVCLLPHQKISGIKAGMFVYFWGPEQCLAQRSHLVNIG